MWDSYTRAIDALNNRLGRFAAWLTLAMVVIASYNAIARYLGRFIGANLTSNALLETQWYLFSAVFLLGGAYALRVDAHVRVDVVYDRLGSRARAWINLVGAIIFLLPFSIFMVVVTFPPAINAWRTLETSADPGGLPRYPLRTLLPITFLLLILQGIAEARRQVMILRADAPPPPGDEPA